MSTKKPLDTDKYGPTYRPKGSGNYGERDDMLVEGDDLPESGDGASREKLGDYLSEVTKANKYRPNAGSKPAVSHHDEAGPPPVRDGYKTGGGSPGTDQTFLDEVISKGAVKEKDFTNIGVGEYKNPTVDRGDINPFMLDEEAPIYGKGVQESRGKGHTLLASVADHGTLHKTPQTKVGKVIEPGPHVIQQRTSKILQNNRFHPSEGSPYVTEGAFSTDALGTMGSNQTKLGTYDPDAAQFKVEKLREIGRKMMVIGTGHGGVFADSGDLASLLPSLEQLGIPYVNVNVVDLNAAGIAGYTRTSGGYILTSGGGGSGATDNGVTGPYFPGNEQTSDTTFGHLNSYFETFAGVLPMGMITAALGGLLALLIQAGVMYGIISLCMMGANTAPERRNPQAPYTMPKGKRQMVKGYNAIAGPILGMLGVPELESGKDIFACMMRGVGTFFGVPNLTGIPGPGDLLNMFGPLMDQGGFVAGLIRSVTRDLEDIANLAANIRASAFSIAAGIIGIIKALGDAASIRFLMTCAKLGDLLFIGDSYTFAPYNADPDKMPEVAATRLAKSRRGKRDTRSVLRHGALPSRYLLPVSVVTAALQYELRSGQGHEALANIGPKIAPPDAIKNGRIDSDYVKQVENALDCEYVPFYFQDLRTNEIVAFHAFLDSISDDYSPEWSSMGGYGRMDPIQIFNRTTRAISITFMVAATNPEDFNEMWWSINKLTTLVYPQWSAGTHMKDSGDKAFIMPFSQIPAASPIIRMRIGDLIKNNYSRFNLARIFGVGFPDKAGGSFNQTGVDKTADAEKVLEPTDMIEYFEKIYTVPTTTEDAENGYLDGWTAILRANSGDTSAPKTFDGFMADEGYSFYVEVPSNTVVEIVGKEWPGAMIIPFITPLPEFPPAYKVKFPADSEAAAIYDGEFYVQHGMLMADIEQSMKDLKIEALPPEIVDPPEGGSNREFFSPEKNAIVRAFESTAGRGLGGVITSLSYDYADAPWETRKLGSRAPMWVKVSISFTPIHDLPPGLDHDGFNRAPIYNVGDIMNNLSGPDMHGSEMNFKDDDLKKAWDKDKLGHAATIEPKDPEQNGGS